MCNPLDRVSDNYTCPGNLCFNDGNICDCDRYNFAINIGDANGKKQKWVLVLVLVLLLVVCTACTPEADHDIRGTWEYIMNDQDGNTYDEGTITFDGNPEKGIYEEINFYEVDYHGEYELRGENVELTGDEVI